LLNGKVRRDAVQPGAERGLKTKARQGLPHPYENVLSNILCLRRITADAVHQRHHKRAIAPDQLSKSQLVSGYAIAYESRFVPLDNSHDPVSSVIRRWGG
jgi:hypothetical protein